MHNFLFPRADAAGAYDVDYEALYKRGFRGIIFDIDNTLVPHGAPADERAKALFARLFEIGFSVLLLSNNERERVMPFADAVGAPYLCKAGKPKKAGYLAAMERMGTNQTNTLSIGDQVFTDIAGANLAGLYTILVVPIHPKEEVQIVLKRIPERWILFFYRLLKKERAARERKTERKKDAGYGK